MANLLNVLDHTKLIEQIQNNLTRLSFVTDGNVGVDHELSLDNDDDIKSHWNILSNNVVPYLEALIKVSTKLTDSSGHVLRDLVDNLKDVPIKLLINFDKLILNINCQDQTEDEKLNFLIKIFRRICDLFKCTLKLLLDSGYEHASLLLESAINLCPNSRKDCIDSTSKSLSHLSVENSIILLINLFHDEQTILFTNLIDEKILRTIEDKLISYLEVCSERTCVQISIELIPKVIKASQLINGDSNSNTSIEHLTSGIWEVIVGSFELEPLTMMELHELSPNGFLLLGCTSDLLFGNKMSLKLQSDSTFWRIVQFGLTSADSLRRKLSLYLLKRAIDCHDDQWHTGMDCIFTWTAGDHTESIPIKKYLNDIMFVLDTLEEKQVHIMKPLFPVVRQLIGASKRALHTSWVIVILRRMLVHESKTIRLWIIEEIFSIDLTTIPIIDQGMHLTLQYYLLIALNDTSLYTGLGKISTDFGSPIGRKLASHLKHFQITLKTKDAQANYFRQFLRTTQSIAWSAVPLFYVSEALIDLPDTPVWNLDSIKDLRHLVVNTVSTHDVLIRIATEEFFLRAFIHLGDRNLLNLNDLLFIISVFKRLRRGTQLWKKVVKWIQKSGFSEPDSVFKFLDGLITNMLSCASNASESIPGKNSSEVQNIARMVVLLADAQETDNDETISIFNLEPVLTVLKTAQSRSYMPKEKLEASMEFLIALLNEVTNSLDTISVDKFGKTIRSQVSSCTNEFMHYFQRRIFENSQLTDHENLENHFKFVQLLIEIEETNHFILRSHLIALSKTCLNLFEQFQVSENYMNKIVVVKCFAIVCNSLEFHKTKRDFEEFGIQQIMEILIIGNRLCSAPKLVEPALFAERTHRKNPNQIASDYIRDIWTCVLHFLKCPQSIIKQNDLNTILTRLIEALNIGGVDSLAIMFNCSELLLLRMTNRNPVFFEEILDSCWRALLENRPSVPFWKAVSAFVEMAFQSDLMSDDKMVECVCKYERRFFDQSETFHGIYLYLIRKVISVWSNQCKILIGHIQILVQGLLFGHIHRKDNRVDQNTEAYIVSLEENISANSYIKSDYCHDKLVRVECVTFLVQMNCDNMNIISRIIEELIKNDVAITSSKPRHYANSMIHRVKQRIWQSLSIMEPLYSKDLALEVMNKIMEIIIKESLQPSVRFLMEWLAVRIILRFPAFYEYLWTAVDIAGKIRIGSLGSFLAIICHVGCATESDTQEEFISKAITTIMPWTSAQHFNTRIYAQVTLNKLWRCCKSNNLQKLIQLYHPIESLFSVSTDHRGAAKSSQKLFGDFCLNAFDPQNHFSIETIFYELPRLTNVLEDEWLEIKLFLESDDFNVPLLNTDRTLATLETGSWLIRSSNINNELDETPVVAVNDFYSFSDMQKKLTPWKQEIQSNYEAIYGTSNSSIYTNKREINRGDEDDNLDDEQLVVVASLISKATNLGGLCRTCEVFGASRLVIGSLSYIEDKDFKSLSVSSEKWVPIKEVKEHNLKDYLMDMKTADYKVVGIEQTANSVKLNTFKFPNKTVLVLGKEKEGIPVEIIQLLDICVEIPQQGLVRSLNVHVAGAILIWEYRRQYATS